MRDGRKTGLGVAFTLRTLMLFALILSFQAASTPAHADLEVDDWEDSMCLFGKYYCVTFEATEPLPKRKGTWDHPPIRIKLDQVKLIAWNEPKGEELAHTLKSGDQLTIDLEESWNERLKKGGKKTAILKQACHDAIDISQAPPPEYRLLDVLKRKASKLPGGKVDCTGFGR